MAAAAAALLSGLLPKNASDFRTQQYWKTFFERRKGRAFEWYGEYPAFRRNLLAAIPDKGARCLVIGCGNSEMSQALHADGYAAITNIDFDGGVIAEMAAKTRDTCPGMTWEVMDATQLTFADGSFGAVVDKGTLDAMCTDASEEVAASIGRMVRQAARVLTSGGAYCVVTLGQEHLLATWVRALLACGGAWEGVTIRPFADGDTTSHSCPLFITAIRSKAPLPPAEGVNAAAVSLPVTVLVPVSFDKAASSGSASSGSGSLPPAEATMVTLASAPGSASSATSADVSPLLSAVTAIRWAYDLHKQLYSRIGGGGGSEGTYLQLDLWVPVAKAGSNSGNNSKPNSGPSKGKGKGAAASNSNNTSAANDDVIVCPAGIPPPGLTTTDVTSNSSSSAYGPGPRFSVTVLDTPSTSSSNSKAGVGGGAAVLLVPQGREHEWSFASEEGQRELAATAAAQTGGHGRLMVVTMGRGHVFPPSSKELQSELSPLVLRLVPPSLRRAVVAGKAHIPFLSVSEDTGTVWQVHAGSSDVSGGFTVEDVPDDEEEEEEEGAAGKSTSNGNNGGDVSDDEGEDGLPSLATNSGGGAGKGKKKKQGGGGKKKGGKEGKGKGSAAAAVTTVPLRVLRRLIFHSNRNAIQSEARLVLQVPAASKGDVTVASSHASLPYALQSGHLAFGFHRAMVAAIPLLLARIGDVTSSAALRIAVIGLGGGSLPMFLTSHAAALTQAMTSSSSTCDVTVVELDPAIADVATRFFGFKATSTAADGGEGSEADAAAQSVTAAVSKLSVTDEEKKKEKSAPAPAAAPVSVASSSSGASKAPASPAAGPAKRSYAAALTPSSPSSSSLISSAAVAGSVSSSNAAAAPAASPVGKGRTSSSGANGGSEGVSGENKTEQSKAAAADNKPVTLSNKGSVAASPAGNSNSSACRLVVGDGLEYVHHLATTSSDVSTGTGSNNKNQPGVIIVDVDSKDLTSGLTFPPPAFLAQPFLTSLAAALDPGQPGLVLFNVASRSQAAFDDVTARLKAGFAGSPTAAAGSRQAAEVFVLPVEDGGVNSVVAVRLLGALENPSSCVTSAAEAAALVKQRLQQQSPKAPVAGAAVAADCSGAAAAVLSIVEEWEGKVEAVV